MRDRAITGDGMIHKSVQYQVWCVFCDQMLDYAEYENQAEAVRAYRQQGWRYTKIGWQCPDHRQDKKEDYDI